MKCHRGQDFRNALRNGFGRVRKRPDAYKFAQTRMNSPGASEIFGHVPNSFQTRASTLTTRYQNFEDVLNYKFKSRSQIAFRNVSRVSHNALLMYGVLK